MADLDSDGNQLHSGGTWNGSTNIIVQGGQAMHYQITNLNLLGTTITIGADRTQESKSQILGPQGTIDITFTIFGADQWDGSSTSALTATRSLLAGNFIQAGSPATRL